MQTQTVVGKWGNSLALRLPRHITESAFLKEGTPVELSIQDGQLVVRPTRKKFKLNELLAGHKRPKGAAEYDWGAPKGEEEW